MENRFRNRIITHPLIVKTDEYVQEFTRWWNPDAGTVLVVLCGVNLDEQTSLGPLAKLTPAQRIALTEPNTVIIDRSDMQKLGVKKLGEVGEINGQGVRVVGIVEGMESMTGCYMFSSIPTARRLILYEENESTYFLARTEKPSQVRSVINDLKANQSFDVFTKSEFSNRSRWYWILKTKAGLAVGFTAILGLVVGAVVTSQTLYSATASMLRELAVLKALGVPSWRMNFFVVEQSFVIGLAGLVIGIPLAIVFESVGNAIGTKIDVATSLLAMTTGIVLVMALLSGLIALRSMANTEPAELLR